MYIVQIASECAPVIKAGGLGDVVYGLSRELETRGHTVEIILPMYDCMRYDHIWGFTTLIAIYGFRGMAARFTALCCVAGCMGVCASLFSPTLAIISLIGGTTTAVPMMTCGSLSLARLHWSF